MGSASKARAFMLVITSGMIVSSPAMADLRVFACEPEWAALAKEVGGEHVSVYSATHARQDPHHIRARPSLIAKIRNAKLVFCSGAGLEVGWLPLLMQRGALSIVRPGQTGHLMAASQVPMVEKPSVLDRSLGDIHPDGNPHVHLNPDNILRIAGELGRRLIVLDPPNADYYEKQLAKFQKDWSANIKSWKSRATVISGMPVIVHHKSFSYLVGWVGLAEIGTLEVKPGIPPTASHLNKLTKQARAQHVQAIIRTPYDPAAPSEWLSAKTNIPAIMLPYTVEKDAGPGALAKLFEDTLSLLEKARARP
ncbi:zinc ABC transporter substrate-binding protein [Alphaproteobacteria bacterium]|nr:zinc ABC transporter substrate-binding protein [Alphaproteobacteria bacterium]